MNLIFETVIDNRLPICLTGYQILNSLFKKKGV